MSDSPTLAILSAPEDAPFVNRLSADLNTAGYRVLDIASERLHEDPCSEPGELRRRLEPAHAVLVVVSPHAVQSEQVRCEIEFARLLDPPSAPQRVVPLLLAATDLPYSLKSLHTIYFTAGPYAGALQRLTAHLANPASAAEEAGPAADAAQQVPVAAVSVASVAASALASEPRAVAPPAPGPAVEIAPTGGPDAAQIIAPQIRVASVEPTGPAAVPARRRPLWRALFSRRR